MSIMRMESIKLVPGSWEKVGPLVKKLEAKGKANGFPEVTMYATVSGGDVMNTITMVQKKFFCYNLQKISFFTCPFYTKKNIDPIPFRYSEVFHRG